MRAVGVTNKNNIQIPNALKSSFALDRPSKKASFNTHSLLYVGRLHPYKRIELLIDGFLKLDLSLRNKCYLKIVGPHDDELYYRKLIKMSDGSVCADRIEFIGFSDDNKLKELYSQADLFIMPSRSENFGMSILEALSFGVPVLVPEKSSWADEISSEISLVISEDGSNITKCIADAENTLMKNPKVFKNCQRIASKYSPAATAIKMTEFYQNSHRHNL